MRVNMDVDGSQAKGGFPVVPNGEYFIKVSNKKDGMTKTKRQKVDLMFDIESASGEKLGGLWHTLTFIPKGEPGHGMWLYTNRCLGLPYDGALDFDTDEYMGQACKALIIQDTYDGKTRNKVEYFILDDLAEGSHPAPASVKESDGKEFMKPTEDDKIPF